MSSWSVSLDYGSGSVGVDVVSFCGSVVPVAEFCGLVGVFDDGCADVYVSVMGVALVDGAEVVFGLGFG